MGVKRTQAKTLVQTEAAAITMKAQQGCFQELDIEEYEIEETLDSFTCSFCGEMDGKHFTMSEMEHPIKIQRIHVDMKRRLAVPGMERLSPLYPDRQSISSIPECSAMMGISSGCIQHRRRIRQCRMFIIKFMPVEDGIPR
ncbi:MAG: hypothetical protein V8S39_11280 [Lachnospiraceae bacterium]